MNNPTSGITDVLACPFCGRQPEVRQDAPKVGWQYASAHISCRDYGHECHSHGSRMVAEWVGNDVPMRRYCTDEEGMQNALADALRGWNKRQAADTPARGAP